MNDVAGDAADGSTVHSSSRLVPGIEVMASATELTVFVSSSVDSAGEAHRCLVLGNTLVAPKNGRALTCFKDFDVGLHVSLRDV